MSLATISAVHYHEQIDAPPTRSHVPSEFRAPEDFITMQPTRHKSYACCLGGVLTFPPVVGNTRSYRVERVASKHQRSI